MSEKKSIVYKILIVISVVSLSIMPISAVYDDMYDWGMYYLVSGGGNTLHKNLDGAGGTMSACTAIVPYWAFETLEADTTYTLTFSCTTNQLSLLPQGNYITKAHYKSQSMPSTFKGGSEMSTATVSRITEGKKVTYTVMFNTKLLDGLTYPIYIYFGQNVNGNADITTNGWSFSAEYDPDASQYLSSILEKVEQMEQNQTNFYTNAQQTLDAIKQNSDELPNDIKQILNERDQQEKQEGQTQTEEGITNITDSLTNVIPVNSIIDSIKPLYNACTYEGTQSLWTLPGITLPQIDGVMEESTISTDIQFDMVQFADKYIPESLLSLIRSVNGTGIVVFSVYEVISLINQVITGNFKEKESVEL